MINIQDKEILIKFGQHLKKLRISKGLSLRELSYVCKIDNSKVSKIEHGKVNITMLTLLDLASALEISPMELLDFFKN